MTRFALASAVVCMLVAAVGCGGYDDAAAIKRTGKGYKLEWLPYEGHYVACVKMARGYNGGISGLACDYAEFHHRFGYHPRYYPTPNARAGG